MREMGTVNPSNHPAEMPVAIIRPQPIIGRDRERAQLRELLNAAIAGHGSLALISGEAGIGKTTLVNDLVRQAGHLQALVLSGGCYDMVTTPAYGPWTEVLRAYEAVSDDPKLPSWFVDAEAMEKVGSQTALFEETGQFFSAVAVRQPLVIVLEDLHWSDGASLDALRYLSRQLADAPILTVATYRDDEITRRHTLFKLLPALVRESDAERVELQGFDEAAINELVGERYRLSSEDQDRLIVYLHKRSDGNPLFATELLRALEHDAVLSEHDDDWRLGNLAEIDVPSLVVQMIEARLAHHEPATRNALETAAIIGHDVPLDLWCEIGGIDEAELEAVLAEALRANLIEESSDGPGVRFTHALVRETLYEGVILLRRRRCHLRIAEALVAGASPDPNTVAHHFQQAGDDRAAEWLIRAGMQAEEGYAWLMAADLYQSAADILGSIPEKRAGLAWLLLHIGRRLRYADLERAFAYHDEAVQVASEIGDPALIFAVNVNKAVLYFYTNDLRQCLDTLERGAQIAETLNDDDRARGIAAMRSLFESGHPIDESRVFEGRMGRMQTPEINPLINGLVPRKVDAGRFREAYTDGKTHADQLNTITDDPNSEIYRRDGDAWVGMGIASYYLGWPEEAFKWIRIARRPYEYMAHHAIALYPYLHELEFVLTFHPEQLAKREELPETIERLAGRVTGVKPETNAAVVQARNMVDLVEGRWHGLQERSEAALPEQLPLQKTNLHMDLCRLWILQGDSEPFWALLDRLLPDGTNTQPGDTFVQEVFYFQRWAAFLHLNDGDLDQARGWLEMRNRWIDATEATIERSDAALQWAAYYLRSGNSELARTCAEQALAHASNPRQPLAQLAAQRFLGRLDIHDGNYRESGELLDETLALTRACNAHYEAALTQIAMAELREATGQESEARQLIREARATCEPVNAALALAEIEVLEGRLVRRGGDHPAGLSTREVEVLEQAATGSTNAQIGEALYISPRTVAQHLRSVYNKLGVNSRAAAVAQWAELGGRRD